MNTIDKIIEGEQLSCMEAMMIVEDMLIGTKVIATKTLSEKWENAEQLVVFLVENNNSLYGLKVSYQFGDQSVSPQRAIKVREVYELVPQVNYVIVD